MPRRPLECGDFSPLSCFPGASGIHPRRSPKSGEKSPHSKGFFPGPPDLAVEVISPDDRDSEVLAKVQNWLDAGCRVVWLVDPRRQTVQVFQGRGEAAVLHLSDTLCGEPLLPGFSLAVAEVFK
jgi:Uma2 family endonuclease